MPIIAKVDDEGSYLIRRLESILEARFPKQQGTYRRSEIIDWVKEDIDATEAAEQMLFGLHEHLRIEERFDLLRDSSKFREALQTGTAPRSFRIEPSLAGDQDRTEKIFTILFERLVAIGKLDSPAVVFLSINRGELRAEAQDKPFEHALLKHLSELAGVHSDMLKWLPLNPLGWCKQTDFDNWADELKAMNNPDLDLERLRSWDVMREIHKQETDFDKLFAFRQARFALERLRL